MPAASSDKKANPNRPRRGGMAKVSRASSRLVSKAIRAKGFAEAEVVTRWGQIVGADFARASVPLKLVFPRGQRAGATLHVRTESAFAPVLQQRSAMLIERVNRYLGYAAVSRLEVKQGPLPKASVRPSLEKGKLNDAQKASLDSVVGADGLSPLQEAVRSLGELVLSRPKDK